MRGLRSWLVAVVTLACAVALYLIVWRNRDGESERSRSPLPLAAARKLARPEGEVGEIERRYDERREDALREVRALIENLERQAEDQRARLREIESDLTRSRALLQRLEQEPAAN